MRCVGHRHVHAVHRAAASLHVGGVRLESRFTRPPFQAVICNRLPDI